MRRRLGIPSLRRPSQASGGCIAIPMKPSPATELGSASAWPALPLAGWAETYATVHLWSQVVGKVALALAPPLNHSWGIALHLTPRGLTTLPLPHGVRTFTMAFDFV